jgi:hypothetical protein
MRDQRWWQIRNPLLRQELPWLISEVVILGYRIERWYSSRPERSLCRVNQTTNDAPF